MAHTSRTTSPTKVDTTTAKPYRMSVQFCRKCGAIGHRQDICPRPRENFCYKCGQDAVTTDHECIPNCKICEQPYETAGKECKKKLRPNPPSYRVRQTLEKEKARGNGGSSHSEDFPELDKPSPSPSGTLHDKHGRSKSRFILRSHSRSSTRFRSLSAQRLSYADATRVDSTSLNNNSTQGCSSAESTAFKNSEKMVSNQQKALQSQHDRLQRQGAVVDKLVKLCQEQEKISRSRLQA